MRTGGHLAAAASHLGVLLEHGQRDLIARQGEALIAVVARDQAVAGMAVVLRSAATGLDQLGQSAAAGRAAAISRTLGQRVTGLPGPAPTQTAIDPPAARGARAWLGAAREVEAAAVQAGRAAGVTVDVWRATVADTGTLAVAVAWADVDLGRALLWSGASEFAMAGRTLLDGRQVGLLRGEAMDAITAMGAFDLPQDYHLRGPVRGAVPVQEARQLPAALARTGEVLRQGPSLTGRQHRAVATALAAIAHRLQPHTRTRAGEGPDVDLAKYARAQLVAAGAWQRATHLWCTQLGSWDVPAQLTEIARLLAERPAAGIIPAETAHAAARELPVIAEAAADNLAGALVSEHWLAAYEASTGRQWAVLWPDYLPVRLDSAPPLGRDDLDTRRAWRAAGIPVRGYRIGDRRDEDQIISPWGLQDLTRILTAQERARAAGQVFTGALGHVRPPERGTAETVRSQLGYLATPAMAPEAAFHTGVDTLAGLGTATTARPPGTGPTARIHVAGHDDAADDTDAAPEHIHGHERGR